MHTKSTHSHYSAYDRENPFKEGGELREKADFIVKNSVISRTKLQICDPDNPSDRVGRCFTRV